MLNTLLINLFKTFIYSALIAVIALRMSYFIDEGFVRGGLDTSFEGLPEFVIFNNLIIAIVTVPALLLANRKIYANSFLRFVFYYGTDIMLLLLSSYFLLPRHMGNYLSFSNWILIGGPLLIFLAIHTYFYLRLSNNPTDRNNSSIAI
ncbi:hypothetical protein [Mucilaginibacter aquariorum]|uniref:DUF2834 domain-containing protein n=1 Tax=Mucilaginibacter aquariorum TaxID=2967225 RepID=A0ABT1T4I1_9SPHI|nr:hypothetical protein [Mucilaginibacter aquariorum]MCQ6959422.1 hypothetical protein [Mucilaginibacter aquariorum]